MARSQDLASKASLRKGRGAEGMESPERGILKGSRVHRKTWETQKEKKVWLGSKPTSPSGQVPFIPARMEIGNKEESRNSRTPGKRSPTHV